MVHERFTYDKQKTATSKSRCFLRIHQGIWNVTDELVIGYLDEKDAAVVHHDVSVTKMR